MSYTLNSLSDRTLLVILDGFGLRENSLKNAIANAKKPNIDRLFNHFPNTTIEAGGESVGLPSGVSGNSEVGHMNLGAGRSIRQDLVRINESIEQDTFKDLPKLKELIEFAQKGTQRIHLMGLLSDGGVHSHIDHLAAIVKAIHAQAPQLKIFFHAFMDGRDTAPNFGKQYIDQVTSWKEVTFASMQGRSIGMDRDRRWDKIQLAYSTFTGLGNVEKIVPAEYLEKEYKKGIYDEFITPVLFHEDYAIQNDDAVFFINFRPDRAIQISLAFNDPKFSEFERTIKPGYFLCMTPYIEESVELPILFNKEKVKGGISEYISSQNFKQFKIAETEKYAHITYFFNGGEREPFPGEERSLVPSPKEVATYDLKPEMSAEEVTDKLEAALGDKSFKFYLVNYANPDMVGHTGNYEAAVKAIEFVDKCLGRILKKCEEEKVTLLLTADHGNSDQMVYENGSAHTSHTGSRVPFIVYHKDLENQQLELSNPDQNYALKDVGPTVLYSLGIQIPKLYTGTNIFI